jgi:membrane-bound ClpP family serine protease
MSAKPDLNQELDRLAQSLPDWAARLLRWLRSPSCRVIRITLAILLVLGAFWAFCRSSDFG